MIKTIIGFYKRTVLILLLVVHILNTYAYDCRINGIYYILNESTKTAEVTYGNESTNSYSGDVVIPQSISYNNKNYKVNAIASFAFRGCDNLSSVSISNSVETIGSSAFADCSNLKTINIPNGVVTIKDGAFAYCTGLTSLFISQSVENIDESAFDGCSRNLESIVVNENNSYYESRNNANAIIKKSTMKLLIGCKNTIIPDGVKSIGRWAFNGCVNLKSIIFPTSLIEIGEAAFYGCCNISSITIPLNVKTISGSAFSYCGGLQSIIVDDNNSYYDSRDVSKRARTTRNI